MAPGHTTEEIQDGIEHGISLVKDMRELTTGRMHGEPVYPSEARYTELLNVLEWVRDQMKDTR